MGSCQPPQPSRASENTRVSLAVTPLWQKLENQGERGRECYGSTDMIGGFAMKGDSPLVANDSKTQVQFRAKEGMGKKARIYNPIS